MDFIKEKLIILTNELSKLRYEKYCDIKKFEYLPCGYKEDSSIPSQDKFDVFDDSMRVSGCDGHFWFHVNFKTPKSVKDREVVFHLDTTHNGSWDAINPQALVYLDGKIVQGIDFNHRDVLLEFDTQYDM